MAASQHTHTHTYTKMQEDPSINGYTHHWTLVEFSDAWGKKALKGRI